MRGRRLVRGPLPEHRRPAAAAAIVNAYQGILPTYLYAFQFPVSTVDRNVDTPLFTPTLAILLVALAVTCLVVAYSAWAWRLTLADATDRRRPAASSADDARRPGAGPAAAPEGPARGSPAGSEPVAASRRMTKP